MLDKVPAEVQPVLASIITALSIGDATEVVNLDDAIDSGNLPLNISAIVSQCLNMATQAIETAFATIQSILPMLPGAAQGPLSTILDMVTATVGTIVPSVLTTVTGLIDSVLSSLPFVGGTSATGGLDVFRGLLGGLVGDGASDVPGGIGDMISSLLGGGSAPAGGGSAQAGVGGIINSVTGMISSLLGGLFGGTVPAT